MALADAAASGTDDPLDEDAYDGVQRELNFRDRQLQQLREEVLDLDEVTDGVVISDFTLDYFFAQLLRYLERKRDELEATPNGAYAVSQGEDNRPAPGVIFLLRQRNAAKDRREKMASPIHPYYMAYIRSTGQIRYGCANARQVLELFESLAIGKTEPIQALCDQFDRDTNNGRHMARYDKLLNAVIAHIGRANKSTQIRQLGIQGTRDARLPLQSAPADLSEFELVTWLVIFETIG